MNRDMKKWKKQRPSLDLRVEIDLYLHFEKKPQQCTILFCLNSVEADWCCWPDHINGLYPLDISDSCCPLQVEGSF